MAIAEQFAGLEMDKLIGAPLAAAADASTSLANSTADFINRVGFDSTGKVRNVAFMYQKRSVNEDGTSNLDEMKVDVPMLAIVPIPNLQIDEVNVLFDMEVKQSEKKDSSFDMGASLTGSARIGFVKVSVTGSISAHSSNTRSSDNSAKYHVDVRATNHGTPEGLARVLDMMAANVAPSLVGSSLKDGNGQELSESAKVKAERLKALRQEISQIETRLSAARETLDVNVAQIKKTAVTQLNVYQAEISKKLSTLDEKNEADQKKSDEYSQAMSEVSATWNSFQNQAGDLIKMLTDSEGDKDVSKNQEVSELFGLKALKDTAAGKYENTEAYYNQLATVQNSSVTAQSNVNNLEKELFAKKAEYSDAVAGKSVPAVQP